MRVLGAALAIALSGCTNVPPAIEAGVPASTALWRPVHAGTGATTEIEALKRLALVYPDSGSVQLRLLNAQIAAEDGDAAIATLFWLHERGYVFSEGARRQLPGLIDVDRAAQISSLLRAPREAKATSEVFARIPSSAGLVESLVVDLDTGRIAATSVSQRSVWGGSTQGEWREVRPAGVGNLSGIVFDPHRNTLWAASGHIDGGPKEGAGFSGLVEVPADRSVGQRISAPEGANLSDLHRAGDGTIFASDPLGGGIYQLRADDTVLDVLVPPGSFRSPQGLATSRNGAWLYVSDYRYGIAIIPLDGSPIRRLATDLPILLDGIDGLWRHGNELIAVQNGSSPMRIVALQLSDDGLRVTGRRILEESNVEWTEPLSGYLEGGTLYYVGNGQWNRLKEGRPDPTRPFVETVIRKLSLDR
ncbi:hypothetical protein [Qipengyuania sp.]|uniref:hypothetical protein n=1 Tax=Qipengyuania sp. TaxID=2004515 RepID=UPI003518CC68